MKQVVKLGCLFLLAFGPVCHADLASDIEAVLHDKLLARAAVGIEMARIGDGREIYEHASRTPLTPASNLKLATTSTALDKLGSDFKFRTGLYLHDGDLVLIGDGDPSFGDTEYLKRVGWRARRSTKPGPLSSRRWVSRQFATSSSMTAFSMKTPCIPAGPATRSTTGTSPRSAD